MPRDRLRKLASRIDTLIEKDDLLARRAQEISGLRQRAALELHGICSVFVSSINTLLQKTKLEIDPAVYAPDSFRESGANVFQINVRGRIVMIEFSAPDELVTTENFRVPYVLEGAVRCFNQELLERERIEEQLLFFCLEKHRNAWRFFDARTYHSGLFDQEYLVALMERLV
ncbi:MAG: hypothetical protein ACRD96_13230 [Bryobacteraceae bacterium]